MLKRLFQRTPIAWFQLKKEKTRMAIALAGIAFADMLMFVQLGLLDALFDAATKPHQDLNADLVLINPQFQSLISVRGFSRTVLYQAKAFDGVESVRPLAVETSQWRNPETKLSRAILVWGIDPDQPAFKSEPVVAHADRLKELGNVLFDQASRPEYGPIAQQFLAQRPGPNQQPALEIQISDRLVHVVGLFTMGASFGADGNVITSQSTLLQLYPDRSSDRIEVGLIKLKPGADPLAVQRQLKAFISKDVRVLTPQEFGEIEKNYWASQGIGFIFGMGAAVGFFVGIIIVYQILYSDVSDHLPEYATLKAMGYSDRYLMTVLMQEALLIAILGYIPGFFLSIGLYHITYVGTLLPIGMKLGRALLVLVLTIMMCSFSGLISLRKLQAADPADIF